MDLQYGQDELFYSALSNNKPLANLHTLTRCQGLPESKASSVVISRHLLICLKGGVGRIFQGGSLVMLLSTNFSN